MLKSVVGVNRDATIELTEMPENIGSDLRVIATLPNKLHVHRDSRGLERAPAMGPIGSTQRQALAIW